MGKNIANTTHTFLFCDGGSCQRAGSEQVIREARAYLRNNELWDITHTIKTRCNGRCEDAPTCIVNPGNFWYKELTPEKITPIVKSHLNNEQPIEADLLYKRGWETLESNNERIPIKPKPFELKEDSELGECFITRGFSSDQYLYPLFLYLKEHSEGINIKVSNKTNISFKDVIAINYTERYTLELQTQNDTISLTIASVPKDDKKLQEEKISITEYFYKEDTKEAGIRFKNKFGHVIGIITFDSIENEAWNYCTKIQLQDINIDLVQL